MKRVILIVGVLFLFISSLFAQTMKSTSQGGLAGSGSSTGSSSTTSKSSSTSTSQSTQKIIPYDLEVNDLYLDKDNKICVVLKLLEGNIPPQDFRTIKLSLKVASLGNIPDIELSRVDPQAELNSRKKKDFNTGLVLKIADNVSCSLINISDKNSQNNTLKERLAPKILQTQIEKTVPPKPSKTPSTTQVARVTTPTGLPSGGVDKSSSSVRAGIVQRIPASDSEGNLTTMSNQPQEQIPIPDVLNILYCRSDTISPKYLESSLEELQYALDLSWNIFGIQDFKQITIKIVYLDDLGQERRIDEFTKGLGDTPYYEGSFRDIFNYLIRNRWIDRVEPWKTYRFKITGSVTIEKPSAQASQASVPNIASGIQVASSQQVGPQGQTSTRRVIPTNSFDIYYFTIGQQNTNVQPPASAYQQLPAVIEIEPEPKNSEGKFKMVLTGYDLLSRIGKTGYYNDSCSLSIDLRNLRLVIEDGNDLSKKCEANLLSVSPDLFHRFSSREGAVGSFITITKIDRIPQRPIEWDSTSANFSLLNDFLKFSDCARTFSHPEGKTFRVWAYADAEIEVGMPAKKCAICEEKGCRYGEDRKEERYAVFSLAPQYITLYKPEDIPPASQEAPEQNLPAFRPQSLLLNHPITTINIAPAGAEVISRAQGARINTTSPLSVSLREHVPVETAVYFILEKYTRSGWQSAETITHSVLEGENTFSILPSSVENKSITGGFNRGSYRLCHYYKRSDSVVSQHSDWVYFEVVPTATQRVSLKLSDLRTTPRRNQRSLSFRIRNTSSYDLTNEYVDAVNVEVIQTTSQGVIMDKYYRIPTPIAGVSQTGEVSGLASQGILIELPQDYDLPAGNIRTEVKLRIADTEFWSGDEISAVFGDVVDR